MHVSDTIRIQTIRFLNLYAEIKPKPHFKQHVINRYCDGSLTMAEVEYIFRKHNLAGE